MYFCRCSYSVIIAMLALILPVVLSFPTEHVCSKYDYEEKLLGKMIRMEMTVEKMLEDITKAKESMMTTSSEIKERTGELKTNSSNLQEEMEKVKTEIKETMENLKSNASKFQEEMERRVKAFTENVEKYSTLEETLSIPNVAFNARRSSSLAASTSDIIVFDVTIMNQGDGYDSTTGIFTAPYSSLYYFSAHVCNSGGASVHYAIVVENEEISSSTQHDDNSHYTCSSVSAVAILSSNERVWIKCTRTSSLYNDLYRWNSFVGALLHR